MTNPKADHKISKPTSTPHPAAGHAEAAPERYAASSATMIEACDRLGQKLDQVASLVQEQIEAWKQIRQPAALLAVEAQGAERAPLADQPPLRHPMTGPAQDSKGRPADWAAEPDEGPGARAQDEKGGQNVAAMAEDARRLVDTLSRSRNGWQEQAAAVQQALTAIMAFLESQAANVPPNVDVGDIMSRLKDLEEQQKTLQSQFNTNRWGP